MRTESLTEKPLFRVKELSGNHRRPPAKSPKGDGKSRFLTPWYFDEETRAEISGLLETAGVGDEEGRQIFLTATEFEIAAARRARGEASTKGPRQETVESGPEPGAATEDPVPAELPTAAAALARQLAGLPQAGRETLSRILTEADPLGRAYGPAFLEQLRWILERLARIQGPGPAARQTPEATEIPGDVPGLLAQLARIYRECLEVRLEPGDLPLFHQVLTLIARASDLGIPEDPEAIAGLLPS